MHDYNKQFEQAYSNDKNSFQKKQGWSKFFLTHKENLDVESGFIRNYYDGRNDTRKQVVFAKGDHFRCMDIAIDCGMEDDSNNKFYNHNFDSVEQAMQALKDFTVDDGYGMVFDRVAHQCYVDMEPLNMTHDTKLEFIQQNTTMGVMELHDKRNTLETAFEIWGTDDGQ